MTLARCVALASLLLPGATAASAETLPEPPATASIPPKPPPVAESSPKWEGAIGPMFSYNPEYQGASRHKVGVVLGLYLRRGRFSISNAGGFVTRRADDVFRGLGLDVVRSDRLRVNLVLRLDQGRRSADAKGLAGIENVRRTVRVRSSATWQLKDNWKVAGGWNADLLGRGGGNILDLGIGHDTRVSPRVVWNVSASSSWADARYMRSYYGITAQESAATGHPEYTPGSGLRDVSLGTGFRMEINPRWTALWGASISKVLGPAASSPLTTQPVQWSLNGGIGWRF